MSAPSDPLAFRSVLGVEAPSPGLGVADARLAALAEELHVLFEEAEAYCAANPQDLTVDPRLSALVDRYEPLEAEVSATPSDTLMGVVSKARAARVPAVWDFAGSDDIARSIVDDLMRLAGPASILARVA